MIDMDDIRGGDFDYTHRDDYDPDGADWHDFTMVGASFQYQVDMNRRGRVRHRDRNNMGPWRAGPPPDSPYALETDT